MYFSFVMKYIQNKHMQHSAILNCQLVTYPDVLSSWVIKGAESFVLVRSPLTCGQLQEALTDMLSFTRGLAICMQLKWFQFHDGRWQSVHLIGCRFIPSYAKIKTYIPILCFGGFDWILILDHYSSIEPIFISRVFDDQNKEVREVVIHKVPEI